CLIDEVTEVQKIFKQMEMAVEQHYAEKTKFQTKMHLNFGAINHLARQGLVREAVATACFTQNRSIVRLRHGKTLENIGKLQPKADIGIFIGYAPTKKAFRIYNQRTRRIVETIHVDFDELTAMASEQSSSGPAFNDMIPGTISPGLV
nr:hypothetical protein [Tanacetum cinerariifolium]